MAQGESRLLPVTTTSKVPVPMPSPLPSGIPSFLPTSSPSVFLSVMPSPLPSAQPSPLPSAQPSPLPSMLPTSTSTGHKSLLPTNAPTNIPTTGDTVSIAVSMSMSAASDPTTSDKEELKTITASALEVDSIYLKDFRIDSVSAARRSIRRGLLSAYTWNVDFTLRIPISVSGLDSTSSLSAAIASALTSEAFVSIVSSNIGATVDITSIVTEVTSTRKTSQPTLSSTVDNNTNGNIKSSESDVVLLFILIGLPVIAILFAVYYFNRSCIIKNFSAIISKYVGKEQTAQKKTHIAASRALPPEIPPKVISVMEFLQDDVKLQAARVLYVAKQFADQGYERAIDLTWVTNQEHSDRYLQDVIKLKQLEIRKLRAAVFRTFNTKDVQVSKPVSTSEARDTGEA